MRGLCSSSSTVFKGVFTVHKLVVYHSDKHSRTMVGWSNAFVLPICKDWSSACKILQSSLSPNPDFCSYSHIQKEIHQQLRCFWCLWLERLFSCHLQIPDTPSFVILFDIPAQRWKVNALFFTQFNVTLDEIFAAAGGALGKVSQHLAFRCCRACQEKVPDLIQIWIKDLHSDHMELVGVHFPQFIEGWDFPEGPYKNRWPKVNLAWLWSTSGVIIRWWCYSKSFVVLGWQRGEKILILKTGAFILSLDALCCVELLGNGVYLCHWNEWRSTTDLVCSQSNCTEPLRVTVN